MKYFLIILSFVLFAFTADKPITDDCGCKSFALYGKVKFVTSFADFKVKIVTQFPDLKVQYVDRFATKCGKWQKVDQFEDFTVQIVDQFPDFTVQIVDQFPGLP